MQERILEQLARAGLPVSAAQAGSLGEFLALLERWNTVYNLTAITDPDEMIQRHLVESLALRTYLKGASIADVGSGAGLPGVPLAVAEPERRFTLIESRSKRVRFLRHVRGTLSLKNVEIEHCRAEDLTHLPPFDTVLARAVAALPELLSVTEHLMAKDSVLLALTGSNGDDERLARERGFEARRVGGPIAKLLRGSLVIAQRTRI